MTRLTMVLASVLVLAAPASSARDASTNPPRLSYALSIFLSGPGPPDANPRFTAAGLCLAGANGSEGLRLTAPKLDSGPAWSPDGRRLAFSRDNGLFVQDERGRSRKIASPGNHNEHPDWSRNGRRIAFDSGANAAAIYTVGPDGSDLRRLTDPGFHVFDQKPAWSPNGEAIAFGEARPGVLPDLLLIDPDGGNRRLLASNGWDPSWSPDGNSVVFVRYSAPYVGQDLIIIGADGRGERVLTSTPEIEETNPAWSPDGDWIAFQTRPATRGGADIAVIRPDGSGFRVVRGSSLPETDPAWRPSARTRSGRQRPCVIRARRSGALRGTSHGDFILGGDGRDSILAGSGADLVDGGLGADRIVGGPGNDVLNGGFGNDRILGGPGNEHLFSDDGERDVVIGNGGIDEAYVDSRDRLHSVEHVR